MQDKGPGIPDYINDKVFQSFFYNETDGVRDGTGLSLAYDIIRLLEVKCE